MSQKYIQFRGDFYSLAIEFGQGTIANLDHHLLRDLWSCILARVPGAVNVLTLVLACYRSGLCASDACMLPHHANITTSIPARLKDVGYRIREEALRPTRPLVSDYPYASRLAALYGCSQEGFLVLRELGVANLSIWGISFVDLGCMVLAIDHRVGVFKQGLQGCAGTIRGYFSSLLRPQNYSVSFRLRHWLSALLERIFLGTCLLLVGADSDLCRSER